MQGTIVIRKDVTNPSVNIPGAYKTSDGKAINNGNVVQVKDGVEKYGVTHIGPAEIRIDANSPMAQFYLNHPLRTRDGYQGFFKVVDTRIEAVANIQNAHKVQQAIKSLWEKVAVFDPETDTVKVSDQAMLDVLAQVNTKRPFSTNEEKYFEAFKVAEKQPEHLLKVLSNEKFFKGQAFLNELIKMGIVRPKGAILYYGEKPLSQHEGTISILNKEHKDPQKNALADLIIADYERQKN